MAARSTRSRSKGKKNTSEELSASDALQIYSKAVSILSDAGISHRVANHQDGQSVIIALTGVRHCSGCKSLRLLEDMQNGTGLCIECASAE